MISIEFFFHMSIGQLYFLFGELSIEVLCPFLNEIICLPGAIVTEQTWWRAVNDILLPNNPTLVLRGSPTLY